MSINTELKKKVCAANIGLKTEGLVVLTWGNISEIDRETGLVYIKPSGVAYDALTPDMIVITDIDGNVVEGNLKPSSDLPTHLCLYKSYPDICAVVHTHSQFATAWAQSGRGIPVLGTTHADTFYGEIPCTPPMTDDEIKTDYEYNTGRVIVKRVEDCIQTPAVLVNGHGPFCWGKTAADVLEKAIILEQTAAMAYYTAGLNPLCPPIKKQLLDKHFFRKHGKDAYYGQS